MATRSRYPADRGLTAHMLLTMFLLGLLYAILIAALVLAKVDLAFILVIGFGILFVQYYFSDKIALYSMGGKIVTPQQQPQLHAVIDRLVAMANMPKPRVAIAQTDIPNAFATGRDQKHAVVCVTTGLLRRLNEPEVEAVLSHELSHVAHRDVAVMTIASFLGIIAGLMTRMFMLMGFFGGYGNNRGRSGGAAAARSRSSRWEGSFSRRSSTRSASSSSGRSRATASSPRTGPARSSSASRPCSPRRSSR